MELYVGMTQHWQEIRCRNGHWASVAQVAFKFGNKKN